MSYKFLKSRSTKPVVPMPIVFKVFLLHYNHQSCWFLLKRILPFNFTGSGNDEAGNQAYFDKAESLILYYTPRSFEIHIKKKKKKIQVHHLHVCHLTPLFFFVHFYICFQKTLVETSQILKQSSCSLNYNWETLPHETRRMTIYSSHNLTQLDLYYLVFHLLELFTVIVTIDLESKLYSEEKPIALSEMLCY